MFVNYTETTDGYTLALNEQGIYEYAKLDKKTGDLKPSGVKAKDPADRTPKEAKKMKTSPQHLRYSGQKLEGLEKKRQKFNLNYKYPVQIDR